MYVLQIIILPRNARKSHENISRAAMPLEVEGSIYLHARIPIHVSSRSGCLLNFRASMAIADGKLKYITNLAMYVKNCEGGQSLS
jgi:hypothetical protein